MNKTQWTKHFAACICGLFFSGLGVAFTKQGALGVSPVSSVANVMNIRFPVLTMGNWLTIWNCLLILGQIAILRKNFKPFQLLQIPLSFLFGYFTDFGLWLLRPVNADAYPFRLLLLAIGILLIGFGISLSFFGGVIMNSGEAFVRAISDTTGKEFGNLKIAFDIGCVISAVILSLLLCGFKIVGTREGTVLSAIFTGVAVKIMIKLNRGWVEALLK